MSKGPKSMEFKVIHKKLNMSFKIHSHVKIKLDNLIIIYQK